MKALFWNIGSSLNDRKLELISLAISKETPDILCIAEGSPKMDDCELLVESLAKHGYYCYYSPLFSKREELAFDDTNYEEFGLKIFVQDKKILKESFTFPYQRRQGRIVVVKTYIEFQPTTFIFLHSKSKIGTRDDQVLYIAKLRDMIDNQVGKITDNKVDPENLGEKERVIIMGDFNLDPWDSVLDNNNFLKSSFFNNHNLQKQRKKSKYSIYFNPLVEHIFKNKIENLGGTHYTNANKWALFDYILYDTRDGDVDFSILTELDDKTKLLNLDNTITKDFLNDGLDHLPIIAEIKVKNGAQNKIAS